MTYKNCVLMSIMPQWVLKIMNCEKIYEVRKRAPTLKTPFKVYMYCTLAQPTVPYQSAIFKGNMNGLVCGEFTCTNIIQYKSDYPTDGTCLTQQELAKYADRKPLYYLEIGEVKRYLSPRGLISFGTRIAPQSWQYCEELPYE